MPTVYIVKSGRKYEGSKIEKVFSSSESAMHSAKQIVDRIGKIKRAHLGADAIKAGVVAYWEDATGRLSHEYVEVQKYEVFD